MTALKAAEIDRFVARPDPARPVVLVFGPDAGLVSERADAIVAASVDDPADQFAVSKFSGDELASDPARLADEALAIPMFGGRRAIRVRAGSRNFVPAVEAVLSAPLRDCIVVIEAGDLKRNAPLRALCERARNAAALPCYADDERGLEHLIQEEMRQAGLAIAPEARATLLTLLGGDRRASRSELRKLALYAHGREQVTLDDVLMVVADASGEAVDDLMDAAFSGRPADVDLYFSRARESGAAPGTIASAALRQCATLHRLRISVEKGGSAAEAVRNRTHFRRAPAWERALQRRSVDQFAAALTQLAAVAFQSRTNPALSESHVHRALIQLAMTGSKK